MGLRCKGCGGEEHVKNGFMRGKQRYRCKACGLNFTDTPPRGQAWIERFAEVYAQKPEPEGRAVVVELDEMWHFLKKVRQALGLEGSGSCYGTTHRLGAGPS